MDNDALAEKVEQSLTLANLSPRALADFLGLPWPHPTEELPLKEPPKEEPEKVATPERMAKLQTALRKRNRRAFEPLVAKVGAK